MYLTLYRLFSMLGAPFIDFYLRRRLTRGKEDAARFNERLGQPGLPRPNAPIVWVHAASIGESLSILPLMKALLERYEDVHVLLTTGTVTSAALLEKRLPERMIHQYVPVDRPHTIRRFLQHWRPGLALWVESELWPNLILETQAFGCPMVQINARISLNSYTKWQRYDTMCQRMMRCFSLSLAQSDVDKKRFAKLGANNAKYIGNLKFDAPPLPADPKETGNLITMIGDRPVWVAASTHEGEEALIRQVHTMLKKHHSSLLTIVIPRHPDRAKDIKQVLEPKLHTALRSRGEEITLDTDVYIAGTIGELGMFYRMSGIVFLGGSLVPHGGQNPLEAARLECALLTGPHTENFTEIYHELEAAEVLVRVRDADELADAVDALMTDHEKQETLATNTVAMMEAKTGIIPLYADELAPYFNAISRHKPVDATDEDAGENA